MKTQMEEVEDDLAAEEENKLINEVGACCHSLTSHQPFLNVSRNTKLGATKNLRSLVEADDAVGKRMPLTSMILLLHMRLTGQV
jgi:hypothetical protein